MTKVTLYGNRRSGLTRAVRIALNEKKVECDLRMITREQIEAGAIDEYNPYKMTPTLVHDGFSISETPSVLFYVASVFEDGARLLPQNPAAAAKVLQWTSVASREIYHDTVTGLVTARLSKPQGPEAPDEQTILKHRENVAKHLSILDQEIGKSLVFNSRSVSIADIMLFPILGYLMMTPEGEELLPQHRHIESWYSDMLTRPACAQVS